MHKALASPRTLHKAHAFGLAATTLLSVVCGTAARAQDGADYWHTKGSTIIDSYGETIRLHGINWYGFETTNLVAGGLYAQDYKTIVQAIKSNGYNVIRLPFSNQLVESDPLPASGQVAFSNSAGAINTDLTGLHSLEIMDKIIDYAATLGLHVILDNHRSEAGNSAEDSGLWYTDAYPESSWLADWATLTERYLNTPAVIGVDLRNEPHNAYSGGSCWTGDTNSSADGCPSSDTLHNWPAAATRAAARIQAINPYLLIFVEGVDEYDNNYYWNGGQLRGVATNPITLSKPNRLVYSAHDYGPVEYQQPWFTSTETSADLDTLWNQTWGYISTAGTAPVWIGEFGTTNVASDITNTTDGSQGQWFSSLVSYLSSHPSISWTYWALNGVDRYGLLDSNYDPTPASSTKQQMLSTIQKP